MRIFLMMMAIIGAAVPLAFFAAFFIENGLSGASPSLILSSLFANPVSGGFTADILISILAFLVWTYHDLQDDRRRWVILLLASCFVGLSLSLPLYLLFKSKSTQAAET